MQFAMVKDNDSFWESFNFDSIDKVVNDCLFVFASCYAPPSMITAIGVDTIIIQIRGRVCWCWGVLGPNDASGTLIPLTNMFNIWLYRDELQ